MKKKSPVAIDRGFFDEDCSVRAKQGNFFFDQRTSEKESMRSIITRNDRLGNNMAVSPKQTQTKFAKVRGYPKQSAYRYPRMVEKQYALFCRTLIASLVADLQTDLFPNLEYLRDYYRATQDDTPPSTFTTLDDDRRPFKRTIYSQAFDDFGNDLDRLFLNILVRFGKRVDDQKPKVRDYARKVDKSNQVQTAANVKKVLGVDILAGNQELTQAVETWTGENVQLITKMGTDELTRIKGQVLDGFRSGLRPESIQKGILDNFRSASDRKTLQATGLSSQARADLLAADQIGKLNGQITRQRQQKLGLGRYRWRTSLDERVRETHRRLEGKIFYWNEDDGPVAPEGAPGIPIRCRCYAEPVIEDLLIDETE